MELSEFKYPIEQQGNAVCLELINASSVTNPMYMDILR
jgi:hypothetical protein